MSRITRTTLVVLFLFSCNQSEKPYPASWGGSVEVVELPESYACTQCTVEVSQAAVLQPNDVASPMQKSSRVTRDLRGRYYIAPTYARGIFTAYDSSGAFLRLVGRPGEGPDELQYPAFVFSVSLDSLGVMDAGLARVTIFDSSYEAKRTFNAQFPRPRSVASVPEGIFVQTRVPGAGTEQLVLVDWSGTPVKTTSLGAINPYAEAPVIAVGPKYIWIARPNRYALERYTREGVLEKVLTRDLDWFRPWDTEGADRQPAIRSIAVDSAGLVWVLIAKPIPGWKDPPARTAADGRSVPFLPSTMNQAYDFVLEVIDPDSGAVLSGVPMPQGYFEGFVSPQHLYAMREDENDLIAYTIWRLSLRGADRL